MILFQYLTRLLLPGLSIALLGCGQETVIHTANVVRFETNATYVAVQDGSTSTWKMRLKDNASNSLSQVSLVLKDANRRYGLVFVCQGQDASSSEGFTNIKSHFVTTVFATADELSSLSFLCRNVLEAKGPGKMYGTVKAEPPSNNVVSDSQLYVDIAIGESISLRALEAFAAEVPEGSHDVLAMAGTLNDNDDLIPTAFYSGSGTAFAGKASAAASNVLFSTGFGSSTYVSPSAPRTTASVIGVGNLAADETWAARVGFVGQNRGYLLLKELKGTKASETTSFEFTNVPTYRVTRDLVTTRSKFINDKQAHELSVSVANAEGEEQRAYYHFFQDVPTLTAALPAPPLTRPEFSTSTTGARAIVRAKWTSYADANVGPGSLYRLEAKGIAIPVPIIGDRPPPPEKPLVWTNYVTSGWVESDPIIFEIPDLSTAEGWNSNWDFDAKKKQFGWTHHSYASANKAGQIIDYLENRKVIDKLKFAVAHQSGSME